jgi:hypothetical protein
MKVNFTPVLLSVIPVVCLAQEEGLARMSWRSGLAEFLRCPEATRRAWMQDRASLFK